MSDTRKITPQPWMTAPQTLALLRALTDARIEARFVGGCVRDALLGRPIADIDLATPAHPEALIAALEKARIKAVPTGIEHGTITAVFDAHRLVLMTIVLERFSETDSGETGLVKRTMIAAPSQTIDRENQTDVVAPVDLFDCACQFA